MGWVVIIIIFGITLDSQTISLLETSNQSMAMMYTEKAQNSISIRPPPLRVPLPFWTSHPDCIGRHTAISVVLAIELSQSHSLTPWRRLDAPQVV